MTQAIALLLALVLGLAVWVLIPLATLEHLYFPLTFTKPAVLPLGRRKKTQFIKTHISVVFHELVQPKQQGPVPLPTLGLGFGCSGCCCQRCANLTFLKGLGS